VDLKIFGYALRMRWMWLQKIDNSRPWSHLPVKHEYIISAMFEASISVQVGDGTRALFWQDRWLQGHSIAELAPCLHNAVGSQARRCRSVAAGCSQRSWVRDITGALTVQVILDYLLIWDLVESTNLQPNTPDHFLWKWTADHIFTTASAYRAFFNGQHSIAGAKILWKARAPGKCKFFGWLAIHDRCWTAERRKRRNLQQDDTCVLCCQDSEAISHLLVGCSFSRQVWYKILLRANWHAVTPHQPYVDFADWWQAGRKCFNKVDRQCFDSLAILTFWIIWKEHNQRTFDHVAHSVEEVVSRAFEEALAWVQAGFSSLTPFLSRCGFQNLAHFGRYHGRTLVAV